MLQRTNLHFYFTKPYVTSWSLFEAIATGTPVLTNRGDATTKTLPIPEIFIVNSIEDLSKPQTLQRIVKLLRSKRTRLSLLPDNMTKENACRQWEAAINSSLGQAIQQKEYA